MINRKLKVLVTSAVICAGMIINYQGVSAAENNGLNAGITICTADAQNKSEKAEKSTLFIYREKDKCGLVNENGEKVVQAKYNTIKNPSNELIAVSVGEYEDEKWGYIDRNGKEILEPQFKYAMNFSEDMAAVANKVGEKIKWGYIDKTGKIIVQPKYDYASNFLDGLAGVTIEDNGTTKWGYIDKTGKEIVKPVFECAQEFSEGLAAVYNSKTEKWGFIDKTGEMVIEQKYANKYIDYGVELYIFKNGICKVKTADGKWGYIDKKGNPLIDAKYDEIREFSEGLVAVKVGDYETGKWGFIDKKGNVIVEPKYDYITNFSEGLATIGIGDYETGKWGFIDKKGDIIIEPKYDYAISFSEGLAAVRIGDYETGKWGFIDKKGSMVIEPTLKLEGQYHIPRFKNGICVFDDNLGLARKSGIIDKSGKVLIKAEYQFFSILNNGLIAVKENYEDNWKIINRQGEQITKDVYSDVRDLTLDGFIAADKGNFDIGHHWIVMDKEGNILLTSSENMDINIDFYTDYHYGE